MHSGESVRPSHEICKALQCRLRRLTKNEDDIFIKCIVDILLMLLCAKRNFAMVGSSSKYGKYLLRYTSALSTLKLFGNLELLDLVEQCFGLSRGEVLSDRFQDAVDGFRHCWLQIAGVNAATQVVRFQIFIPLVHHRDLLLDTHSSLTPNHVPLGTYSPH